MMKSYSPKRVLFVFLFLGLGFFLGLRTPVEASFQAKLEIPISENRILLGYIFAPDGLESQGANVVSILENIFRINAQTLSYNELINELNRLFNRDLYYPEVYGLVVTSECGGPLYRLAFYENENFVKFRYLQEINFCGREESEETSSPESSSEAIRNLLEKNRNKNIISHSIEIPIEDSLYFILQDLRYSDFSIDGAKIQFSRVYFKGAITGSGTIEDYNCRVIESRIECEGNGFYDLESRYGEGSVECYTEATVECAGYGRESDSDHAVCHINVSSPNIILGSKTVEGTAHIECVFDWYDFDFSKDVHFRVQGQ